MLMNPGWLLSKTWASIARLPFSLYLKQFREYKKNDRKRILSFSFIYPIVITINLSTRKPLTCQLVNSSTCLLADLFICKQKYAMTLCFYLCSFARFILIPSWKRAGRKIQSEKNRPLYIIRSLPWKRSMSLPSFM